MNNKKTVLITGGSGGIGEAISILCAMKGYSVAVNYCSSKEKAERLVNLINENGYEAFCYYADVSDFDDVQKMHENILKNQSSVYALINNAGVSVNGVFQNVSNNEWKRLCGVNIDGPLNCCKVFLPDMINKKCGRIINISSVWGIRGASCEVHYSVTKSAVIGLTKSLAKETAPSGVTVNCIAPGVIDTKMLDCYSKEALKSLAEDTPCKRLGTPTDIANAVLFLIDRKSDFVNGQILGIDGGFSV